MAVALPEIHHASRTLWCCIRFEASAREASSTNLALLPDGQGRKLCSAPWSGNRDKEKGRAKFAPTFPTCLNTPASTSVVRVETNFFVDPDMVSQFAIAREPAGFSHQMRGGGLQQENISGKVDYVFPLTANIMLGFLSAQRVVPWRAGWQPAGKDRRNFDFRR